MSRPPRFRRYGTEQDDVETIPLSSPEPSSEPWYQERDLTDERLPTYNEALADAPPAHSSIPAANTAYDHGIEMQPSAPAAAMQPALGAGRRPIDQLSQKRLYNMSPCLLAPLITLIIGTIFGFAPLQNQMLMAAASSM